MEIIIISSNKPHQVPFWEEILAKRKEKISASHAIIFSIYEDWQKGAGNGLGTLYAYTKASEKYEELYGSTLLEAQKSGASISIYHTAGQGKRLFPLTASEFNNKSAIKLPSKDNLTILEAVVKQTLPLARKSPGRLSVFWSDQIFLPGKEVHFPNSELAIFGKKVQIESEVEWKANHLDRYGLIIQQSLFEKIHYNEFEKCKSNGANSVNISLGSFTLSSALLEALLNEFVWELKSKQGSLDTDPHFWMPLTLDFDSYSDLAKHKFSSIQDLENHYRRMQKVKESLSGKPILGVIDIGKSAPWWDYGTIEAYYNNNMKLLQECREAREMRDFLGLYREQNLDLEMDDSSLVYNSNIESGCIENSIVVGVEAKELYCKNSIILNCRAEKIKAADSLLYHCIESGALIEKEGSVRSDLFYKNKHYKIYSSWEFDGKKDWQEKILSNELTFEQFANLFG